MSEKILKTRFQIRRATTDEWEAKKDFIPLAGEPCLDLTKGDVKWGDGVKTWGELDYAGLGINQVIELIEQNEDNIFMIDGTGNAETDLAGIPGQPKKGDLAIIKNGIGGDAEAYTSYVYNGTEWVATYGNYDAENVYFGKDLTITANIGVQTIDKSGSKKLDTTGKNLKQVLDMIVAKEKNPSITQPSVSVTCNQLKAYEVGEKVTPQFSVSLNAGKYEFDTTTGVTATAYKVTDTKGGQADTATGSFAEITVADGESYSITAEVTHTEGAVPKTNLGNDYAAGKIVAGKKTATKGTLTGYRNSFYGTTADKSVATDSAVIRGLQGKSGKALANGAKFDVRIPLNALRVIIAYPATLKEVSSITDVNGMNAEIKSGFTLSTVDVKGANDATAISYKVYTMDFANPNDAENTFKVTI